MLWYEKKGAHNVCVLYALFAQIHSFYEHIPDVDFITVILHG